MTEKCEIGCEHYLADIRICFTAGAKTPCYVKSGGECVAPSLKNIKPSELEQSTQSPEHPFEEWGKESLAFP